MHEIEIQQTENPQQVKLKHDRHLLDFLDRLAHAQPENGTFSLSEDDTKTLIEYSELVTDLIPSQYTSTSIRELATYLDILYEDLNKAIPIPTVKAVM